MDPSERHFRRNFFQAVIETPLDPEDSRYVPLYSEPERAPEDPVELLATAIEYQSGEGVQLLSGFRGSGKSTELRRLRKRLTAAGYKVILCDFEDYLNMSARVDITDFLMAVAGALGDELVAQKLLDAGELKEGYWERAVNFITRTKVDFPELQAEFKPGVGPSASLKANLKSDPTFKQRLQERMSGHLGALVEDVRTYIEDLVKRVKARHGQETEVVLLLDSIEHIRGTFVNALEVQASVETVFASHSDKLRLPYLHVVYTVPPYLGVRYPRLGGLYSPGAVHTLLSIKVRDMTGQPDRLGLDTLERVVRARGDWKKLLGDRSRIDHLSLLSGGHLRDLMRLIAEILRRPDALPVKPATVESAVNQIQSEFLPIADADALWLDRIAETHDTALPEIENLPQLARFFDTHLVLGYRNGRLWYDVHPLVKDHVREQARRAKERARPASKA